jgi:hypothetical protein
MNPTSRKPFTDGFNSFSHFVFGYFSAPYRLITPIFLGYQFLEKENPENLYIDIFEFMMGHLTNEFITIN